MSEDTSENEAELSVTVREPKVEVRKIRFARPSKNGTTPWHYLYEEADQQAGVTDNPAAMAPDTLDGWGRGPKWTVPEWEAGRSDEENYRACLTRNLPVELQVNLAAEVSSDVEGTLRVSAELDGDANVLTPAEVPFTYPAGASEHWVDVTLGGQLPDEVGRYILELEWEAVEGVRLASPEGEEVDRVPAKVWIYGIYMHPFEPDDDSGDPGYGGAHTSLSEGTLSGTRKRMDKLMSLLSGTKRHPAATEDDLVDLIWQLHEGINDTVNAPPYFNASHPRYLEIANDEIPVVEQWLAWLTAPNVGTEDDERRWNDASCIGHVQLLKTMAAAAGLFCRRTWVFPHTRTLPDGRTQVFDDTDLYGLGDWSSAAPKQQRWTFDVQGRDIPAKVKLMEPPWTDSRGDERASWENFEACLRSPTGRFLPGGYNTWTWNADERGPGFASAAELLDWWSNTSRSGWGKRFLCWVARNRRTGQGFCWDRNGDRYDLSDYEEIRDKGTELLPPEVP